MPVPFPLQRIVETVIYCTDLDAAAVFYGEVLGMRQIERSSRYMFYALADSVFLIFTPDESRVQTNLPTHGSVGGTHFALEIEPDDYDMWVKHLRANRIVIEHEKIWTDTGAKSVYFRDPSGNLAELITRGHWDRYLA